MEWFCENALRSITITEWKISYEKDHFLNIGQICNDLNNYFSGKTKMLGGTAQENFTSKNRLIILSKVGKPLCSRTTKVVITRIWFKKVQTALLNDIKNLDSKGMIFSLVVGLLSMPLLLLKVVPSGFWMALHLLLALPREFADSQQIKLKGLKLCTITAANNEIDPWACGDWIGVALCLSRNPMEFLGHLCFSWPQFSHHLAQKIFWHFAMFKFTVKTLKTKKNWPTKSALIWLPMRSATDSHSISVPKGHFCAAPVGIEVVSSNCCQMP